MSNTPNGFTDLVRRELDAAERALDAASERFANILARRKELEAELPNLLTPPPSPSEDADLEAARMLLAFHRDRWKNLTQYRIRVDALWSEAITEAKALTQTDWGALAVVQDVDAYAGHSDLVDRAERIAVTYTSIQKPTYELQNQGFASLLDFVDEELQHTRSLLGSITETIHHLNL